MIASYLVTLFRVAVENKQQHSNWWVEAQKDKEFDIWLSWRFPEGAFQWQNYNV
jgi:hypothetical protein